MAETSHMKRYTGDIYFAISEQLFHLSIMDAEAVDVRSVDAIATSRNILNCTHIHM